METIPNTLFFNYPLSTGILIIGTIVVAAIATVSFYYGKWTL
jgi:hypothetical protein